MPSSFATFPFLQAYRIIIRHFLNYSIENWFANKLAEISLHPASMQASVLFNDQETHTDNDSEHPI